MNRPEPRRRSSWPLGLAGMLGLIAGVERLVTTHGDDFSNPPALINRMAGDAARRQAATKDVLLFGDSQVKMGLAPAVIEARSGRKTINLGLVGGPPPMTYFLLRRAIESGAKPEAVVVDYKANIAESHYHWNVRNIPEILTVRDVFELTRSDRDASFFARTLVAITLPSFRCRDEIRDGVRHSLWGIDLHPSDLIAAYRRNFSNNRGMMANAPKSWSELSPGEQRAFFPPEWKPDPVNARYIHKFFQLARAHGIKAYWLIPPISPEILQGREVRGLDVAFTAWVERVRSRNPGITVIDARRSGYGHDIFVDPGHMDHRGAAALSVAVGDILRHGGEPTWVALPPYRPVASPLEDMETSKLAIVRDRSEARR